jgi:hypothetical protein
MGEFIYFFAILDIYIMKRIPLIFLLTLAVVIGILHYSGTTLQMYWRVVGFDMLVHVLSSFFFVYALLTIISYLAKYTLMSRTIYGTSLILALVMGIFWELFELYTGYTELHDMGYVRNALFDIGIDVVGAMAAGWYFIRQQLNPVHE